MTDHPQEPPTPPKLIKQDKCLAIAHRVLNGEAGGLYLYCMEDDKFYHYSKGYWQGLFDIDFLGRVADNYKEITKFPLSLRKQIAENFKYIARQKLDVFNWSDLINLENGMVSPYDGLMIEHHASYYSTNRLPYMYDENAKCNLWLKTLNEILENDGERIEVLQEYIGYCLTRETKHHKALLLLGESRSGKSTIAQVIRNVIGVNNCSSVPLKYISNAQYTAMLINKLVNIDTDVSARAAEFEAEFKTITSGEPVAVNQKYVAAFDFTPYCKIVMAANIFPKITDHSSAFYKRLLLIPCDRVFSSEEQNRDLPKQLLTELPGILNWAIEGLKRLTARGRFAEYAFMKDAVDELENENNPVNIFFDDYITVDMNDSVYIEKSDLYEKYKQWCDKNEQFNLSNTRFAICVFRRFNKETPRQARLNEGKRPYIWKHLKYCEFKVTESHKTQVEWRDI